MSTPSALDLLPILLLLVRLLAGACLIHAVLTRQEIYWIVILALATFLGGFFAPIMALVYFFQTLLPWLRGRGRVAGQAVTRGVEAMKPLDTRIREAQARLAESDTLQHRADVAALQADFELLTTRTRFRPERHLTLHPYAAATELSRAGYLQPPASAPQVELATVDAVLLPGLAYDERGTRLGYGGGFYDRLLPGYAGLKVGVVWAALLVPELPGEAHDIRADWVATETGLYPCNTDSD